MSRRVDDDAVQRGSWAPNSNTQWIITQEIKRVLHLFPLEFRAQTKFPALGVCNNCGHHKHSVNETARCCTCEPQIILKAPPKRAAIEECALDTAADNKLRESSARRCWRPKSFRSFFVLVSVLSMAHECYCCCIIRGQRNLRESEKCVCSGFLLKRSRGRHCTGRLDG